MCRKVICLIIFVVGLNLASKASAQLLVHYELDETAGTVASDSSGKANDGTLSGDPQWAAGRTGGALEFDGGDAITLPADRIGLRSDAGTVAFWMNMVDITGGINTLFWGGDNTTGGGFGPENEMHIMVEQSVANIWIGGEFGFYLRGNPNNVHLHSDPQKGDAPGTVPVSPALVNDGQWHHITGTWGNEDGNAKLYFDGQLLHEIPYDNIDYPLTNIYLGQMANGGRTYNGLLDEVQIYGAALTADEIQSVMEGSIQGFPRARGPNPPNGSMLDGTWVTLSWRSGDSAVSHNVYLGDNFGDVNDGAEGAFVGNQATTMLVVGFPGFPVPEGLVPGTTYYWRIDEVNDSDPNSPWKGDIWSFSIPPKTAYAPDPADGAEFVDPNATLTWTGGYGSKLHTIYLGDDFDDVSNAVGGVPLGTPSYDPGTLEAEKVLYWRVDEFDGVGTHKGDIWSFTTPGAVGNPQPANGAVDVQRIETLSWTTADSAASHELYFGTDADAVNNATTASPEYIGPRALGAESYDPGGLAWDGSHAWRVDEVYPTGTVKGLVWTFTTADFVLVEDFESYNDVDPPDPNSNRIFDKWIDGFGTTTNGALVGNDLPPYAEQTVVHGGAQSMIYAYDNNLKTSEATLTLVYPRDWTADGVAKLSLWFRGVSANAADRMFVALGTAAVYHDDASATQITGWNEWIIDLSEFAGADLANVNTITIGFGTKGSPAAGGAGTMYFDDIRLIR
jgi:hypothetical protein